MAQANVLLCMGSHRGQVVVVTDERVYMRGPSQTSDELWSVQRARVAGVQAHAGLILADLTVRTRDGEGFVAPEVGPADALLAIGLLGYAPEGAAECGAKKRHNEKFELVCGDARLSVTDTDVEWTGKRPWKLLRKEIAGVSVHGVSPATEITVHTHSGKFCRATQAPVYGAVRVVELLGYVCDAQAPGGRSPQPTEAMARSAPPRKGPQARRESVRDNRFTRRDARSASPRVNRAPARATRHGTQVATTGESAGRARRERRRSWLAAVLAPLRLLHF